jgi:hypothetical protein
VSGLEALKLAAVATEKGVAKSQEMMARQSHKILHHMNKIQREVESIPDVLEMSEIPQAPIHISCLSAPHRYPQPYSAPSPASSPHCRADLTSFYQLDAVEPSDFRELLKASSQDDWLHPGTSLEPYRDPG